MFGQRKLLMKHVGDQTQEVSKEYASSFTPWNTVVFEEVLYFLVIIAFLEF